MPNLCQVRLHRRQILPFVTLVMPICNEAANIDRSRDVVFDPELPSGATVGSGGRLRRPWSGQLDSIRREIPPAYRATFSYTETC